MNDHNISEHPKDHGRYIRLTGEIKATTYGIFFKFSCVHNVAGEWVATNDRHYYWLCQMHGDGGIICNWQVQNSSTEDDERFKHPCITSQKKIAGTFFTSLFSGNYDVKFSVDKIVSDLISDELNLEATELTTTLRFSARQISSIEFYSFVWRCMRKAQLLPKMDVKAIFPRLTRQRRSNDTTKLGRIKLEIICQD
jgi:hypothetical protein